ncbi:uncharacterized protein BP5553_08039 [Venustampulla echinocandica]|uniref:GPI anchored protein n=1 Tax=Venustampulla echinocandica TaxID=2656787 RepID=A0A370TFL6_9HELO|nr:uncharacterized protein BP5553_08039 [Venustampulla echinocandica]RDL33671.1 hypothetical protein BP5553_08039 [Venustampulla echinocandica]
MYKSTAVVAALAVMGGVASAADSTTVLWLIGFDQQPVVASIVGSDSKATTYALACPTPESEDCGVPTGFTITQGPSTLHYLQTMSDEGHVATYDMGCQITSSKTGTCSGTVVEIESGGQPKTSILTTPIAASDLGGVTVTITAGGKVAATTSAATETTKLTPSGSKADTGSTLKPTASGSKADTGAALSTGGAAPTGTGAASGAGESKTSTGGMPMITGNAQWVVGGAAAAIAIAAL